MAVWDKAIEYAEAHRAGLPYYIWLVTKAKYWLEKEQADNCCYIRANWSCNDCLRHFNKYIIGTQFEKFAKELLGEAMPEGLSKKWNEERTDFCLQSFCFSTAMDHWRYEAGYSHMENDEWVKREGF